MAGRRGDDGRGCGGKCRLLSLWNAKPIVQVSAPGGTTALHFETRHGEQLSRRLPDNSVLHLNTDSAVSIRFGETERLVTLTSGQADFEVAHDTNRPFRVFAGSAEVVALGTKFDVRLEGDATVVTVVEGRVAVGPSPLLKKTRPALGPEPPATICPVGRRPADKGGRG